jgi:uncharacterized protein (DUF1800 family)
MRRFANRIAMLGCIATLVGGSLYAQSVTISPGYMNVPLGGTIQYKATVTGLTPTTVTWGVTAGGGTITQTGLYTAPSTVPSSVLISAKSTVNPKIVAYVYVNPQGPGPNITAISPNPLPVGTDTITITASASQPFIKGASMMCAGASGGATYISPTSVSAVYYIGSGSPTVTCTVTNPNTSPSNALAVPVKTSSSGSGGGTGSGGGSTPAPVVSPLVATVALGATQQFSATNETSWSASAGSITSGGLYTAPTIMTATGTATVTATGPGGTGNATVTLTSNTPPTVPVVQLISPASLPLGFFTLSITGTGFTAQSTATLGTTPLVIGSQNATTLSTSGFAPATGTLNLVVSNGSASSTPVPVQVGIANPQVSAAAARRFLEQAAFGPSPSDAANVQTLGFQGWLNQQFAMAPVSNYNAQAGSSQGGMATQFMANAVMNPDQLRQKVAFALSQILVTSINTIIWNDSMIPYEQMLMADAFTNYRQILGDVTLSPTMGQYLNTANNAMANPATGTVANENYAREVMQLFSIGVNMLNPDGTPQLDSNHLLIPSYTQPTISETARVFTGWTYLPSSGPVAWNDYINPAGPMVPFSAEHDFGSKQLVNGFADPAGLTPQLDLGDALDNIFNHPNIGPFVGKLLIQHLVKSNPSPAYVQRVSAAFANNGQGVRGDMKAVIGAILLDPEARANDNGGNDQPGDGHLQEPALFIAGIFRAFGGTMSNQNYFGWDLVNLNQDIYNAPSVFNYYSPNFMPPGAGILGPEFQIHTPDTAVYRANVVDTIFGSWSNPVLGYGPGTFIDVTPYVPLAANPATLVAALDLTLTHGTMPTAMKQAVLTAVTNEAGGNLARVETGAWVILTSNYYNVWH